MTITGSSLNPRVQADTWTKNGATATLSGGQLQTPYPSAFVGYAYLDWTRAGYWVDPGDWNTSLGGYGAYVVGYETPAGSVPTNGKATFTGSAQGGAFYDTDNGATEIRLSGGSASFTADFGARTVNGDIKGLMAGTAPWNDFSFASVITGNGFSGDTRIISAPAGVASLGIAATGTVEGRFFGPTAQEAGAVWTLFDGSKAAIGTLAGSQAATGCGWQGEC